MSCYKNNSQGRIHKIWSLEEKKTVANYKVKNEQRKYIEETLK